MLKRKNQKIILTILLLTIGKAAEVQAETGLPGRVSWKQLRDKEVFKQHQDYSCGAASIATVLHYYYGLPVNEEEVLQNVPDLDGDLSASFLELREAVKALGFIAQGVELDFKTLQKLNVPAIAHLRHEGREHFSVIRGINPETGLVWLADPSWGNRHFSQHQFLSLWLSSDQTTGRLLLVVPHDNEATVLPNFFQQPNSRMRLAKILL